MKIIVDGSCHNFSPNSTIELETDPELNDGWIVVSVGHEKVDVKVAELKRALMALE